MTCGLRYEAYAVQFYNRVMTVGKKIFAESHARDEGVHSYLNTIIQISFAQIQIVSTAGALVIITVSKAYPLHPSSTSLVLTM